MAALGGNGPGLFTQLGKDDSPDSAARADKQSAAFARELSQRQHSFKTMSNDYNTKQNTLPTYANTLEKLPREFYFQNGSRQSNKRFNCKERSSKPFPIYNPSPSTSKDEYPEEILATRGQQTRQNDTFRPPHGPPVTCPVVLGYGEEVGLETHQQVLWDPLEKFYYFLDHQKEATFVKDPRPEKKPLRTPEKQELLYQPDPLPETSAVAVFEDVCAVPEVVKATSIRAIQAKHAFVLKGFGQDGKEGAIGADGRPGRDGANGQMAVRYLEDGTLGEGGAHGWVGDNGKNGSNGVDGRNIIMDLSGDSSGLCVSLTTKNGCSFVAKLGGEESEGVLMVDCRGGRGGNGGRGGCGGRGGNGGDGGKGALGGDGGHGGDGSLGGDGGQGGLGGKGGKGGSCVVEASDPRLLMLVEADTRGGAPGRGGEGGKAGSGGKGGFGGDGGPGEQESRSMQRENSYGTTPGLRGKPGMTGTCGQEGDAGLDGHPGQDGGVLWVVKSTDGSETISKAPTRYEAEVLSLVVSHCSTSQDDFFHPNERIVVTGITVVNSGGLPLPSGAQLSIPSTETILFEQEVAELPSLAPGETFVVPTAFHGRIFDQASPNSPGPFHSAAQFAPMIKLLGRPFKKSTLEQNLTVQYPVGIAFVLSKKSVACGEVTTLEIGIQNVSSLLYGTSTSRSNSAGSVAVRIHLDSRILPLGLFGGETNPAKDTQDSGISKILLSQASKLPYKATYDPAVPDSLWIDIAELQPSETLTVPIAVLLSHDAEVCDSCVWQTDLYFREKLVEYKQSEIIVSPAYSPPASPGQLSDVLMITTQEISCEELAFWQRIFEILGVSVDFWNADYQKPEDEDGFVTCTPQMPPFTSRYQGKLIVYPHCDLKHLPAGDIVSHFHGDSQTNGPVPVTQDLGSSMVLFQSSTTPTSLKDYVIKRNGTTTVLKHLCKAEEPVKLPPSAYSGFHFLTPGTLVPSEWSVKEWEKSAIKKLEKETPSQSVALVGHHNVLRRQGVFQYSYGTVDIRRCPLLHSCNFQCVDGAGGSMVAMGTDDPQLLTSMTEVPLASKFGQVLLSVMCGLPLRCKIALLKSSPQQSSTAVQFHLPNGLALSLLELAAVCTVNDIVSELQNCSGDVSRMRTLTQDLKAHPASYMGSATTILQLVDLVKTEVGECKKFLPSKSQISEAVKDVHVCCSAIVRVLESTKEITGPAAVLPPLRLLQDNDRVLRCHQRTVETECLDLTRA